MRDTSRPCARIGPRLRKLVYVLDAVDEDRAHAEIHRRREVDVEAVSYETQRAGVEAEPARRLLEWPGRWLSGKRIVQAHENRKPRSHPESVQTPLADESGIIRRQGERVVPSQ